VDPRQQGEPEQRHPERLDAGRLSRAVLTVAALNFTYFFVEFAVALSAGSVSLLADSVDFLEDAAVSLLIFVALGWPLAKRAVMGKVMVFVILGPAALAVWTVIQEVSDPSAPAVLPLVLASVGAIAVNGTSAWLLISVRHQGGSLSRAAFLSARNDVLINVSIIVMAFITLWTGSGWPDLILGCIISVLALHAAHEVWEVSEEEPTGRQSSGWRRDRLTTIGGLTRLPRGSSRDDAPGGTNDSLEVHMKTRGAAFAAAVTALTLVLPTPAAWSETTTFEDRPHATTSSTDVKWVEVSNDRADDAFKVKVRIDKIRLGSTLVVYVDRNLKNAGPELRMVAVPDSEWALYRVKRWGQRGTLVTTCGRVRMSSFEHDHRATWRATRTCLKIRGAVRVGVKMVDPKGRADWAPKRQTFFDRVTAR
jgi:Co/Zn/Cd efflux system component